MKTRLFVIGAPLVLLLLIPVGAILVFNSGLYHRKIEEKVASVTRAKVSLGPMRMAFRWPLTLTVQNSTIEPSALILRWESLTVQLASLFSPYDVRVDLARPRLVVKVSISALSPAEKVSAPEGARSGLGSGADSLPPLRLRVHVTGGDIVSPDVEIRRFDLAFVQKILLRSTAELRFRGEVRARVLPAPVELGIDSRDLTLTMETVKANSLKASLAGLSATIQGASLFKESRHRWLLEVNVPDLRQVPQPPSLIPARDWQGSVYLRPIWSSRMLKQNGRSTAN
ncbi:MAG: hypothetical protein HC902_14275 [Calothrix sp. SM1_5_4]|nr:hypothetical protein [Calothrix sp. SM1_5_4]